MKHPVTELLADMVAAWQELTQPPAMPSGETIVTPGCVVVGASSRAKQASWQLEKAARIVPGLYQRAKAVWADDPTLPPVPRPTSNDPRLILRDCLIPWAEQAVHQMAQVEPAPKPSNAPKRDRCNLAALDRMRTDPDFRNRTADEWSKALGCSASLVVTLHAWKSRFGAIHKVKRAAKPLTEAVGKIAPDTDEVLERLAAESEADNRSDPSPLDPQRTRPKQPKRT
ncbi:MAG: hypothetical protein JJU36_15770 [Phycisphaeraceae bacterium]|nr:hypothetical protein [Phycisphaeraceae bacterium]